MAGLGKKAKGVFRWYIVAYGLLGLGTGYFVGASQSPVVSVLLPLLFGLLGGAGTFHMLKMDVASDTSLDQHGSVAKALVFFTVLCLVGSVYGVLLRTGLSVSSFLPTRMVAAHRPELPGLDRSNLSQTMQLVLVRARLQALGVSAREQDAILRKTSEYFGVRQWDGSTRDMLESVVREGRNTLAALKTDAEKDASKVPASVLKDISDVTMFINLNVDWLNRIKSNHGLPVADIAFNYHLYRILFDPLRQHQRLTEDSRWWASHPTALLSLTALMAKIQEVMQALDTRDLEQNSKEIDGLLKIIYGTSRTELPWAEPRPAVKSVSGQEGYERYE